MDVIENYDVNNLFEPEDILKILENKELKQNYTNGELFNYKLENENNDTLLTKILDIIPTKENQKDYDKIIEVMKNTENIDYNQVDSNGISVIEKIINSENLEMLDVVKDFKFNYTRDMDYAYQKIESPKFKRKVQHLNVDFPNIKEAIDLNSNKALALVMSEFQSPFCNVSEMMQYAYNHLSLRNYNNLERLLLVNGVNFSDNFKNGY